MPTANKIPDVKDDYQAFLASLDLYLIALTQSSFKIEREDYFKATEDNSISFKLSSKPKDVEKNRFDVLSTLNLKVSNDKSKKVFIVFAATFELHFHASSTNEEFIKRFCDSEIRLVVWPYFCEYVSDVTARMYVPPLLLPRSEHNKKA